MIPYESQDGIRLQPSVDEQIDCLDILELVGDLELETFLTVFFPITASAYDENGLLGVSFFGKVCAV